MHRHKCTESIIQIGHLLLFYWSCSHCVRFIPKIDSITKQKSAPAFIVIGERAEKDVCEVWLCNTRKFFTAQKFHSHYSWFIKGVNLGAIQPVLSCTKFISPGQSSVLDGSKCPFARVASSVIPFDYLSYIVWVYKNAVTTLQSKLV